MMCGPHGHDEHRASDPNAPADEHTQHDHAGAGAPAPPQRNVWSTIARAPTAWLLGAFLLVAAYFAVTGDSSRVWTFLPYVAIGWMLLHHLGGHGGHGRHRTRAQEPRP